jgi:hypothetical protein
VINKIYRTSAINGIIGFIEILSLINFSLLLPLGRSRFPAGWAASWAAQAGRASRPAGRKRGGGYFPFSFYILNSIFNSVFKTVLNKFKFWIKTRQYKKINAPACMQQHVPSLMMNFNLMKNYFSLCFYEYKIFI